IRDDGGDMISQFSDICLENTYYINKHKSKYNAATLVCYMPQNKENYNKMHIPNLLKIELKITGDSFKRNYSEDIVRAISRNNMESLEFGEAVRKTGISLGKSWGYSDMAKKLRIVKE